MIFILISCDCSIEKKTSSTVTLNFTNTSITNLSLKLMEYRPRTEWFVDPVFLKKQTFFQSMSFHERWKSTPHYKCDNDIIFVSFKKSNTCCYAIQMYSSVNTGFKWIAQLNHLQTSREYWNRSFYSSQVFYVERWRQSKERTGDILLSVTHYETQT